MKKGYFILKKSKYEKGSWTWYSPKTKAELHFATNKELLKRDRLRDLLKQDELYIQRS